MNNMYYSFLNVFEKPFKMHNFYKYYFVKFNSECLKFHEVPRSIFFIVIIDMKLFPTKLTKCTWWLRVTRYHMICRIFPVLELQGLKAKKRKLFLKCQQLEWFWRLQIVFPISSDNIKKRKLKTFFLIL